MTEPRELRDEAVLRRREGCEILSGESGSVFVRSEGRLVRLPGLEAETFCRLLVAVDGERTVVEVVQQLGDLEEEDVREVLESLTGRVFEKVGGEASEDERDEGAPNEPVGQVSNLLALGPRERLRPGACRVGILGGGSAGYLAALALRRKLPEAEVTLVESSALPPIGVGEASTPLLPAFLHGTLGLDMHDFFRRTAPTLKLGIRFDWGPPGDGFFLYPFDRGHLLESFLYEGHVNAYSLASVLMAAGRSPLVPEGDGFALAPAPFAYHVDNHRFVAYLTEEAEKAGVKRLDRRIEAAELAADGETVEALSTDRGERLGFDFLLDCSGFRSFLLGETLGVPFVSFADSLLTDTAVVGRAPHRGEPGPYTTASTFESGWCWSIPLPEERHVGSVFSSAHTTPEAAEGELRRKVPGVGETRMVRFRAGRRAEAWRGNVFALGNAYGFVEPLESTSLHMICHSLALLLRHWPIDLAAGSPNPAGRRPTAGDQVNRRQVNRHLAAFWDQLRWFLVLHFRFNRRLETPFWRDCRESADVSGTEETVALFREGAPLSYRPHLLGLDSLWGDFGRDVLLLGQGVEGRLVEPRLGRGEWAARLARARALAALALPPTGALELLGEKPEILRRHQAEAPWLQDAAVGGRAGW